MIVSTNVAETSITIDDITAVIDTGKVKQLTYDSVTNIVRLAEQWTSRASAKQRRGRAGRVAQGICYKLFSKKVEQTKMEERTSPEIQRIPLEQLCLSVLAMGWTDVINILNKTLSPPKIEALERAMTTLKDVGALKGENLSALGRHMAAIPADLRCSKLMVLGSIFGCLSTTVTIASIIAVKSPFLSPPDKRDAAAGARKQFSNGSGDLLTDAKAFDTWSSVRSEKGMSAARRWCDEVTPYFLHLPDITELPVILDVVGYRLKPRLLHFRFTRSRTHPVSVINRHIQVIKILFQRISCSFTRCRGFVSQYRTNRFASDKI